VLYAGLIFYLSSRSSFPVPGYVWDFDMLSSPLVSLLIASLYGVSDEVHQAFVPGRDSSPFDWLADTIGAGLVCAAWYLHQRKLRGST
jgi:VanZ family protein